MSSIAPSRSSFSLAAALALAVVTSHGDAHATPGDLRCRDLALAVALTPDSPASHTLTGRLCVRGELGDKPLQILLHGAGYDRHYWDFPLYPHTLSYVRHATENGSITLAVDRIGYGQSSRPAAPELFGLDLHVSAFTVHQLVSALRAGTLDAPGFAVSGARPVVLVGHSLGALVAAIEAAEFGDVDGVILTGFSHYPGPGGFASFGLAGPACDDPKFASLPCDVDPTTGTALGYLANFTTLPFPVLDFPAGTPTRRALFFAPSGLMLGVPLIDYVLRQTFPAAELWDIGPTLDPVTGATGSVFVPTLIVNGEADIMLCDPPACSVTRPLAFEAPFFPAEAELEMVTVPGAGHSLNLHASAPLWFDAAAEWVDRQAARL